MQNDHVRQVTRGEGRVSWGHTATPLIPTGRTGGASALLNFVFPSPYVYTLRRRTTDFGAVTRGEVRVAYWSVRRAVCQR